jgi:uncharacterized protein (DUF427 family)
MEWRDFRFCIVSVTNANGVVGPIGTRRPKANFRPRKWRATARTGFGLELAMAKAVWNGQTIAESETFETVEGNVYFPDESVKREFFKASSTTSSCTWKGQARYYTLVVDGQENPDAAWYYPDPKPAARSVKHHVAFWRGVEVTK